VAATSASNAWALGGTEGGQTLILHWNGTSWKQVPSAGAVGSLTGVGASSATNAWAVGSVLGSGPGSATALILHWNGTSWQRVPGPRLSGKVYLGTVAVTSGRDAWAVGGVYTGTLATGLILHWDGTSWQQVPSASPSDGRFGYYPSPTWPPPSATNAWAVGCTDGCPSGGTPLIERWNGTSWKQVAAPTTPYDLYSLSGVAAISGTRAWTVGTSGPATSEAAATAYWNGRDWALDHGISGVALGGVTATLRHQRLGGRQHRQRPHRGLVLERQEVERRCRTAASDHRADGLLLLHAIRGIVARALGRALARATAAPAGSAGPGRIADPERYGQSGGHAGR